MNGGAVEYIHLPANSPLPTIERQPRRVLVLIEQEVNPDWQNEASRWIVDSGCLFMMAWGRDCGSWDESVDHANLTQFDYGEVPDEAFVMTSWHENEALHEAFFFARMCASHPTTELPLLTILDIRSSERVAAILALYEADANGLLDDAWEDPKRLPFASRLKILMRKR